MFQVGEAIIITNSTEFNRIDSALHYMEDAIERFKANRDDKNLSATYFDVGLCYQNNPDTTKNNPDKAFANFTLAFKGSLTASKRTNANASRHLAFIHLDNKAYDSALYYAKRAFRLREEIGLKALRPFSLILVGDILRHSELDSAIHYHKLAVLSADSLKSPRALNDALNALGDDYSLKKRFPQC